MAFIGICVHFKCIHSLLNNILWHCPLLLLHVNYCSYSVPVCCSSFSTIVSWLWYEVLCSCKNIFRCCYNFTILNAAHSRFSSLYGDGGKTLALYDFCFVMFR